MHTLNRAHRLARFALATLAVATISSCEAPTAPNTTPAALVLVSGNLQQAPVGQELPEILVVRVENSDGDPVQNQVVNFRVISGNGTVFAGVGITNTAGEARERWTLGTDASVEQRVEARAVDPATGAALLFATFAATALPGAPDTAIVLRGAGQVGAVGQVLTDSLAVRFADEFGNRTPGRRVTFRVLAGGGSVSADSALTDSTGRVAVAYTVGPRVDLNHEVEISTVSATSPIAVRFTITPSLAADAALRIVAGDDQSGIVGELASVLPVIRVETAAGVGIAGVVVSFATDDVGAVAPVAATTDAQGRATISGWRFGSLAGEQRLRVEVPGVAPLTLHAQADPGAPHLLRFRTSPSTGLRGRVLDSVVVAVEDSLGNTTAANGIAITLGLVASSGTATDNLKGTVLAQSAQGLALFDLAFVDTVGIGFRLAASATGLLGALGDSFAVTPVPVSRVVASVDTLALMPELQDTVLASLFDDLDSTLVSRVVTWSSLDTSVATVDSSGLVAAGSYFGAVTRTTRVIAQSEGRADTVIVRVAPLPVASLTLDSDTLSLVVSLSSALAAQTRDSLGRPLTGHTIAWDTPSGSAIALTASGRITALAPGVAMVSASIGGLSATAAITTLDAADRAVVISLGWNHSCTITGAGDTFCWGSNSFGKFGFGPSALSESRVPIAGAAGLALRDITLGSEHSCGVAADGAGWCWGLGNDGQLGTGLKLGGNYVLETPTAMSGSVEWRTMASGRLHSCGVSTSNELFCWGNNVAGMVGDGTTETRLAPTASLLSVAVRSVQVGAEEGCAVTQSGEVWCWGYQYGVTPARVPLTQAVEQVALRRTGSACAVGTSGEVWCWNPNGLLTAMTLPMPLVSITAGWEHTCGLSADGRAWCWGGNGAGQLGDGTTTARAAAVEVTGAHRFAKISAGTFTTCGITTGGQALCWGANESGQLGDGTATARSSPTLIRP